MTKFEIVSFTGASPLRFGMTQSEVESLIGKPKIASRNWQKTITWTYESLSLGFGGHQESLDHIGFSRGASVRYKKVDFFGDIESWKALLEESKDYHQTLGFLLFCDLGIALTGFHENEESDFAVSLFPEGKWEKFRPKFEPYKK